MVRRRADKALEKSGFDQLVIFSGSERFKLFDDAPYPFFANPQFKAWLPLTEHPDCFVIYRGGDKPKLIYFQPEGYWYAPPEPPGGYWAEHFDITVINEAAKALPLLPDSGRVALLGEFADEKMRPANGEVNPGELVNYLDFHRAWKSAYEIECMRRANAIAARAHRAAEQAFRSGASELEIHLAYCQSAGQPDNELPYSSIVALNEHGAVLHYQNWSSSRYANGALHSFLIDAGASFNGYAADVTRTYSASDSGFSELIERMDRAQKHLCALLKPGVSYPDVHFAAHRAVAKILSEMGFVKIDPEASFDAGITRTFFPHGVGHYIGLQVHDVGGFMADEDGALQAKPDGHPFLRLTRELDDGHVMTIEPGLYFIDSLLASLAASEHAKHIDWDRVEAYRKFGGVRIEDDVAVTVNGSENLTRGALDKLAA
ncbi:MAG: Xaa-Pro dipeptidase [Gammaproteobacteria bacterium]|nr:Xaa-Pro dipeptidase [Gammaproteobacteria bacterium]